MADSQVRQRNFTDDEAHLAIALLRQRAGWRNTERARWNVTADRRLRVRNEVDRLVDDLVRVHGSLPAAQRAVEDAERRRDELVREELEGGVGVRGVAKAFGVDKATVGRRYGRERAS